MFKKIKEFFTGKPTEVVAEVPYKVETAPIVDTADIAIAQLPDPSTVVVVPEAVAPAAVVEQATLAVVESIAPAKKVPAKKAAAAKKPRAPKVTK